MKRVFQRILNRIELGFIESRHHCDAKELRVRVDGSQKFVLTTGNDSIRKVLDVLPRCLAPLAELHLCQCKRHKLTGAVKRTDCKMLSCK